ncbi:MAG TPA: hypothetical protein VK666_16910 [Chryseolinea sp.]|nr:hypothetical protein [Chryseolinea sp.]
MNVITRHCRIQHNTLLSQGKVIFQDRSASLDSFLNSAIRALGMGYPKYYKTDPMCKLGLLGAEMLFKSFNPVTHYGAESVGLVLSNTHASLDTDLRYFETMRTMASPALFVYTLTNIVMGEICIRYGIKGENAFFVLPAFEPELLAGYIDTMMALEKNKACLAGWIDVMGDHHDVFLYLVEKKTEGQDALSHTPEQLKKLYQAEYGTVDDRS